MVIKEEQPEDLSIVSGSNVHSNWSQEFFFMVFGLSCWFVMVYWWLLVVMVLSQFLFYLSFKYWFISSDRSSYT